MNGIPALGGYKPSMLATSKRENTKTPNSRMHFSQSHDQATHHHQPRFRQRIENHQEKVSEMRPAMQKASRIARELLECVRKPLRRIHIKSRKHRADEVNTQSQEDIQRQFTVSADPQEVTGQDHQDPELQVEETVDDHKSQVNVAQVADGTQKPRVLVLSPELEAEMMAALNAYRDTAAEEDSVEQELQSLKQRYDTLQDQISDLQAQVTATSEDPASAEGTQGVLEDEIQACREEQQDVVERRDEAIERFKNRCKTFWNEQFSLFDMLDQAFAAKVTSPALHPYAASEVDESDAPAEQYQPSPSHDSVNASRSQGEEAIDAALSQKLNWKYSNYLGFLIQAENDLENRHDLFDRQKEELFWRLQTEEIDDTMSELERRQFVQTQEMTRKVIEFEGELDAVKAAALEAGIQLESSDIDSGFIDDVNDGYGVSGEREMAESVNREALEEWLAGLPEDPKAAEVAARTPLLVAADDQSFDHWDAVTVDVCDSFSMVAEGAPRRRIDEWNIRRMNPELSFDQDVQEDGLESENDVIAPETPTMSRLRRVGQLVVPGSGRPAPEWQISPKKGGEPVENWVENMTTALETIRK